MSAFLFCHPGKGIPQIPKLRFMEWKQTKVWIMAAFNLSRHLFIFQKGHLNLQELRPWYIHCVLIGFYGYVFILHDPGLFVQTSILLSPHDLCLFSLLDKNIDYANTTHTTRCHFSINCQWVQSQRDLDKFIIGNAECELLKVLQEMFKSADVSDILSRDLVAMIPKDIK